MDELVKTFHIDWKLLIAQVVNFGIVIGVLWYFALKPLMKMMHKRSDDIEKSLQQAKEIERKLQEAEQSKEKLITEAKQEAQVIMEQTHRDAEKVKGEKLAETRQEMERMAEKVKQDIQAEKQTMLREAKGQVADLVIAAAGQVIGKNLDHDTNKKLVEDTIKKTGD
ncbi:MAG: F0F1 ATP synthase subunit B [Patescibacteria group bacterium]|nr:F0F1 ATP synthase subunit B [Patescibacteria group bacterium]MDD5716122.1 F0F1 ATP synthase subunit B [Patescibacteria group bacterium]